jgi:hypothetical protein
VDAAGQFLVDLEDLPDLAMGGQNAVVRRLAVPDLTTTVLTLTVTGLVADTTPDQCAVGD